MPGQQPPIDLDLDSLVARFGRKLATAEVEIAISEQRANLAEARVADLVARIEALEGDTEEELDG